MLLESVPNLSLGPDDPALLEVLAALEREASPGWALLDVHSDPDHRRTVLTLAGAPVPLQRALGSLVDACILHGDLRGHTGVHPRIGLVDVVPFVALDGATLNDAARAAHHIATRLAGHSVPVYHYGELVSPPGQARLGALRRVLRGADPGAELQVRPDLGPACLHPRLGAACVGTRGPLVAYNVLLDTTELAAGQAIARAVRERDGGLAGVQALAFPLAHAGGRVQVSMNLTRPLGTGLTDAYAAVVEAASARGVGVNKAELVGLAPRGALVDDAAAMGLETVPESLEDNLARHGLRAP